MAANRNCGYRKRIVIDESMVEIDTIFGCHLWIGKLDGRGRPIVWRSDGPRNAYQIAWADSNGAVPDGFVLDHLCRRVLCCNPLHLEIVTKSENELRKSWGYRCKRKLCTMGHDLSTAIVTPEMGRLCRHCHRAEKQSML